MKNTITRHTDISRDKDVNHHIPMHSDSSLLGTPSSSPSHVSVRVSLRSRRPQILLRKCSPEYLHRRAAYHASHSIYLCPFTASSAEVCHWQHLSYWRAVSATRVMYMRRNGQHQMKPFVPHCCKGLKRLTILWLQCDGYIHCSIHIHPARQSAIARHNLEFCRPFFLVHC